MSMTKRYLESLPQDEQDAILGGPTDEEEYFSRADEEALFAEADYWAAVDANTHAVEAGAGPDDYPDYGNL